MPEHQRNFLLMLGDLSGNSDMAISDPLSGNLNDFFRQSYYLVVTL
ncbi:hypothetical protein F385_1499 [Pantoea agglomerans 299R]|nr:hypothetical protein F385_1499 [Pantoea agglomerans 299R]